MSICNNRLKAKRSKWKHCFFYSFIYIPHPCSIQFKAQRRRFKEHVDIYVRQSVPACFCVTVRVCMSVCVLCVYTVVRRRAMPCDEIERARERETEVWRKESQIGQNEVAERVGRPEWDRERESYGRPAIGSFRGRSGTVYRKEPSEAEALTQRFQMLPYWAHFPTPKHWGRPLCWILKVLIFLKVIME